jgi:hypothetical protein
MIYNREMAAIMTAASGQGPSLQNSFVEFLKQHYLDQLTSINGVLAGESVPTVDVSCQMVQ